MSDEKLKVLELLQEGKINAEDALKLLDTLPDERKEKNTQQQKKKSSQAYTIPMDGEWVQALKEGLHSVKDVIQTFTYENGILQKPIAFEFETDTSPENINNFKLLGKNSSVTVKGYDGDTIKISGQYTTKKPDDVGIHFSADNGNYELLYNVGAVSSMSILAEVPQRADIKNIQAESKNGSITYTDLDAKNITLITKNSNIKAENTHCQNFDAKTSNSSINAQNVKATGIILTTSNASISLSGANAKTAKLQTSNASIKCFEVDVKDLYLKTSNGSLSIEEFKTGENLEYNLEAHTSNAKINLALPEGIGHKIHASTSMGNISNDLPNMVFREKTKTFISGETSGYENFAKRVKVKTDTCNASIKISTE
jgi:DUF4097 and DUF4098 domain-containing protein YvlB/polyhydroxyalkanoate synthesis regulator phasin